MNQLNSQNEIIDVINTKINSVNTGVNAIASSKGEALGIANLITALSNHDASVRTAAVEALVKLAPNSVKPLITLYYASGDQGLQAQIIQALAQIGHPAASDLLIEVVGTTVANHCQGNVRRIAARGLAGISNNSPDSQIIHRVIEKLTWALLAAEDWGLRYAAAVSLQEIATPEAHNSLQLAAAQELDKVVLARIMAALTFCAS